MLEHSDTEDFSHLETVGFIEEVLERADREGPRQVTRARKVPHFFGEVSHPHVVIEGDYVEPTKICAAKGKPVVR